MIEKGNMIGEIRQREYCKMCRTCPSRRNFLGNLVSPKHVLSAYHNNLRGAEKILALSVLALACAAYFA